MANYNLDFTTPTGFVPALFAVLVVTLGTGAIGLWIRSLLHVSLQQVAGSSRRASVERLSVRLFLASVGLTFLFLSASFAIKLLASALRTSMVAQMANIVFELGGITLFASLALAFLRLMITIMDNR